MTMEKEYFRLTSVRVWWSNEEIATPEMIRPEPVLARWLSILRERVARGEVSYEYFSNQLRAIRQDLTVGLSLLCDAGAAHPGRVHRRGLRNARPRGAAARASATPLFSRTT